MNRFVTVCQGERHYTHTYTHTTSTYTHYVPYTTHTHTHSHSKDSQYKIEIMIANIMTCNGKKDKIEQEQINKYIRMKNKNDIYSFIY